MRISLLGAETSTGWRKALSGETRPVRVVRDVEAARKLLVRPRQVLGGERGHQRQLSGEHDGAEDLGQAEDRLAPPVRVGRDAEQGERLALGVELRAAADG